MYGKSNNNVHACALYNCKNINDLKDVNNS